LENSKHHQPGKLVHLGMCRKFKQKLKSHLSMISWSVINTEPPKIFDHIATQSVKNSRL